MVPVIYVEDDPDVATGVCHILSLQYGIPGHTLSSVKEAREYLTFTPSDVIAFRL
jgi:hypothetical protein